MKTTLNAPGVPPAPERVADVTRRMLSLDDEPDQVLPASCIPLVTKFLTQNPGDFNFILEMADPNEPGKGGDGYGIVTCMEDECWCDVNLTPDPDQPDGGKANGVGSLAAYADHCMEAAHLKSRNERLKSMDFILPPPIAPPQPADPFPIMMQAGPSRLAAVSSATQPASSGSSSGSNILREHSLNVPSAVASSSKYRDLTMVDSDSDDDVQFVGASSPRKSAAPKGAVVIEDDSDNDVKPRLQSSQASRSSGSQAARRWIPAWSSMSLSDRRHAINQELRDLTKAPNISTFDSIKKVQRRREQLRDIQNSGCLMQWTPPDATVFQAYPSLYVHPRLADTFERPKPVTGAPVPGLSMPVAGPSTQPMAGGIAPNAFMQVANSIGMNGNPAVSPAAVKAVWTVMEPRARVTYIAQELQVLREALARWTLPALQNLAFVARNRFQELGKALSSSQSHWMPPPVYLLNALPTLRAAIHPSLQQFLPAAPNVDEEDPYGFGEEYGRPTGSALQDFFQEALANFQEDATVEEGVATLGLSSQQDMLPGANFTLMPHQILGVAFMMKREKEGAARARGPRGGLLCDAMGLGKTVQCIGLMLARDERPEDYERAPQLIVAPLALLLQWKTEIETKTTLGWRVYIHHGQNRIKNPKTIVRDYDIVLTTYGTLSSESGITNDKKKKKRFPGSDDDGSDYASAAPKKKGPLFKIDWFRVILDEAHNVRNKRTKVARSVQMLDVYHPWVLTGTPIVNSLADLGPALEFIGLDTTDFNEKVVRKEAKQPKLATKRSQAILRPLMMRRNKDTELNGQKILQLPPKNTNMAWQDFELDERAIYAAVEQRARIAVTKFLKAGTLMKNYSVVLVLLTRLRQCVNHPWLLRARPGEEGDLMVDGAAFGADLGECRDDDEAEFGRAVAILGKPAVDILVKKLEERYERLVAEADASEENQDMECSICYEPFDGTEVITPCGHLYCKPCISNFFVQPIRDAAALNDEQVQAGCRSCPMCRSVLKPGQIFRSVALYHPKEATPEAEEEEDELDEDVKPDVAEGSSRKGKKRARSLSPGSKFFKNLGSDSETDEKPDKKPRLDRGKGKATASRKGKEKATWAADDPDILEDEEHIPPSSKMRQLLELVQGWLDEDPNAKILVFSQFVQFLDLLHDFLGANNIRTVGYRGSMSQDKRDEAIRRFSTPPDIADNIPVMLISTKAGGVGLNLIMASKVIMCDLAWNPATENQAVDRAHRIGQTKPVQVERLLIRDTVEDRLLAIQERKGLLADGAMGEGDIGRLGRLTLADIRRLFAIDRDDD